MKPAGLVSLLLLAGCSAPQTPAASAPLTEPAPRQEPAAAAEPAQGEPAGLAPFFEEVELDASYFSGNRYAVRLFDDYAVVRGPRLDPQDLRLLRLSTLEVSEFPRFLQEPDGELQFHELPGHDGVLASFEQEGAVRFELLEAATMTWEVAGGFDLPPPREPQRSRVGLSRKDGKLAATVSDAGSVVAHYVLDRKSLTWSSTPAPTAQPGECLFGCVGLDEDLVRWGGDAERQKLYCVAVRRAEGDPWTRIEGAVEGMGRRCRRLDDKRILVVGGIAEFSLFPRLNDTAEIVDLERLAVRSLGKIPRLGEPMEVAGAELVWMSHDEVVRFDAETEKFTTEAGPGPEDGWDNAWTVKIDDRTVLIGTRARGEETPRFARFGLRPGGAESAR